MPEGSDCNYPSTGGRPRCCINEEQTQEKKVERENVLSTRVQRRALLEWPVYLASDLLKFEHMFCYRCSVGLPLDVVGVSAMRFVEQPASRVWPTCWWKSCRLPRASPRTVRWG